MPPEGQFVEDKLPPDSDDEDFDGGGEHTAAAEAPPPPLREGRRQRGRGGEATQLRPLGREEPRPRQGDAGTTGNTGGTCGTGTTCGTGQVQQVRYQGRLADGGSGSGGSWSEADDRVVLKTLLQMVGGSIDLRGGGGEGCRCMPTVSVALSLHGDP